MKTTIKKPHQKNFIEYPYLGTSKELGEVVLFTHPNTGTLIYKGSNPTFVGEYADNWAEEKFVQFNGVLEISN